MKTSILFLAFFVFIIGFTSCTKNDGKLANTTGKNDKNQPANEISPDTITMDLGPVSRDFSYDTDTCLFQHISDTLRIYGKVIEIGCGKHVAVIIEKSDSLLIHTMEIRPGNIDCNIAVVACFELKIPNATSYSVVKFDGKTYKDF